MVLHMDNVDKLFQERFGGHEVPVDPALWAAIEAQLLVSSSTSDPVNELFRERFQAHELPVDPAVWDGIGRQLGHAPAPPATSPWTWAAGAAAVLAVGVGLWWSTVDRPAAVTGPDPAPALAAAATIADDEYVTADPQPASPAREAVDVPQAGPVAAAAPYRAKSILAPSNAGPELVASTQVQEATDPATTAEQPAVHVAVQPPADIVRDDRTEEGDPRRVEAIIREISDRTVNEARSEARAEAQPVQSQQASGESAAEAPELFMPNTFTPNGDGVNDTYELPMVGFVRMTVKVLSLTTDKLVFSSMNGEPWTGAGCEDGMYVVVVEAVSEDGRNLSKAKVVWLTRERMN